MLGCAKKFRFMGIMLLICLFNALGMADGDSRLATAQERNYHQSILNTLAKSLPPGPAGWNPTDQTPIEALERVGVGAEKSPFGVDYSIGWLDSKRKDDADEKVQQELLKLSDPTQNPNYQALMKEKERIADEIGQAAAKNDLTRVQQLQKQLDAIDAKLEAFYQNLDQQRERIIAQWEAHDVVLNAGITTNDFYLHFYNSFKPEPSIGGGLVYRTLSKHTKENGWVEGTTYVFLGKGWVLKGDHLEATPNKALPYLSVQTVIVAVQGDPARAKRYLEGVNWGALKGLIKN